MEEAGGASSPAAAPLSAAGLYNRGTTERGAGGKLRRDRKPPPPTTPYDRPNRRDGGWISRIVDPAKRLLSSGATRLLPSLFAPSLPPPPLSDDDEGQREAEQETTNRSESCSVDLVVPPKSTVGVTPNEGKGKSKLFVSDKDGEEKLGDRNDGGLPDIEQLIKGKTFSREEMDHLMEILRSRVVDGEQEREVSNAAGHREVERGETSHEKPKASTDKEEEMDKLKWATSTPLPLSTMHDEIGASPVDIARAYMGSRTSELGITSTSLISKSKKFPLTSDYSSKPLMPSPLPKAPICWPGAVTHDQQGHSTPQSQKNRYGLQSFPRTPYSRTMYTKSKSKLTPLRGDSERFPNVSSSPFQPTRTPVYGKSTTNVAEGNLGSGGPIRRTQNKFTSATPARESSLLRAVVRSPSTKESDMLKKNFEPGASSTTKFGSLNSKSQNSEAGVANVHPHSSKLARQILEQLDRPITLKEKSEELKLAVSWKSSPQATSSIPIRNNDFSMKADATKLPAQTNGVSNLNVTSSSMLSLDKSSAIFGGNIASSPSIQKLDSTTKRPDQAINSNLPKGNGQSWLIGDRSKGLHATNKSTIPEPQNVQRKPVLSSISVEKSGFTFPITKSSTTFGEPPTPSIMPSSSTSTPQQSKPSGNHPTLAIGNKITIAPPVFSFPSTSTSPTTNNASPPKFKFGSGKTRLSFALVGDDDKSDPNDVDVPKYEFGSGNSGLNFGLIESNAMCY